MRLHKKGKNKSGRIRKDTILSNLTYVVFLVFQMTNSKTEIVKIQTTR